MTLSVQSSTSTDVAAINQQKIQDFKDGKINIKKDELVKTVKDEVSQGIDPSSELIDLIDSYEKIDTNGDGISYKEYSTYQITPAALLRSLGISNSSVDNSVNSSLLNSIKQQPSLLNYLSDDSSDTSVFAGSEASYFNNLVQNYSSAGTSTTVPEQNLIDFIS